MEKIDKLEKLALSVPECAKALNLGTTKVRELIYSEGFPAIRIGGRIVIPVDQLKVWMAKQPTVRDGMPLSAVAG